MKKFLALLSLLGVVACNTNQNYDKSMLPDADPKVLSEVNSKVLISCMQIPVPRPPVPINPNHKVPTGEVYDQNDCVENKMGDNELKKLLSEKKEKEKFKLEINLEDQEEE
jgi:Tfp pilus assembly protein PilP